MKLHKWETTEMARVAWWSLMHAEISMFIGEWQTHTH